MQGEAILYLVLVIIGTYIFRVLVIPFLFLLWAIADYYYRYAIRINKYKKQLNK